MAEIVHYLERFLDLPPHRIPILDLPHFEELSSTMIEDAALQCRGDWGLGDGPIRNLTHALELNGVVVCRDRMHHDSLDAFSLFVDGRPYIALSADKGVFVRSRMDAAHELGHLILHRSVTEAERNDKAKFKQLEKQAFRFASAFIMPEKSFLSSLWTPSLDAFRDLKEEWGAAIAAMIMRSKDLGIISDDQCTRMWMNLGRRGWRKEEPLDQFLKPEQPQMLKQSIETIVDAGARSKAEILSDLPFAAGDIETLCSLSPNYLGEDSATPESPAQGIRRQRKYHQLSQRLAVAFFDLG